MYDHSATLRVNYGRPHSLIGRSVGANERAITTLELKENYGESRSCGVERINISLGS